MTKLNHYVGLLLDLCALKQDLLVVLVHHGSEKSDFANRVAKVKAYNDKGITKFEINDATQQSPLHC